MNNLSTMGVQGPLGGRTFFQSSLQSWCIITSFDILFTFNSVTKPSDKRVKYYFLTNEEYK